MAEEESSSQLDESGKYKKLAEEYSKLKAHYQVLKKLLVETRSEKDSVVSLLKTRDQDVRKLTQEQESLQFVNGQLNKRVEVLQSSLTESQKNEKKKKSGNQASSLLEEKIAILESELMAKIHENEELHFTIETLQSEHRKLVSELTEKVKSYQSKTILQKTYDATENLENKNLIENLKKTIEDLNKQLELTKSTASVSDSKSVLSSTQEIIPVNKQNGVVDNTETCSISSSKFSDEVTTSEAHGADSVSEGTDRRSNKKESKSFKDVFVSIGVFTDQFLSCLSTWHGYEAERISAYADQSIESFDLANAHLSLSTSIKESMSDFRQFTLSMSAHDTNAQQTESSSAASLALQAESARVSFSVFLVPFLLYLAGAAKLATETSVYYRNSENKRKHVTESLSQKNKQLAMHYAQLSKSFKQLHNVLSVFPKSFPDPSSVEMFIYQLKNSLSSLRNELKIMSKNLNQKITIEHQTENVEEKVKTANECLFSATYSLSRCSAKLSDVLSENDKLLVQAIVSSQFSSASSGHSSKVKISVSSIPDESIMSSSALSPQAATLSVVEQLPASLDQIRKQMFIKQSEFKILLYRLNELHCESSQQSSKDSPESSGDVKLQTKERIEADSKLIKLEDEMSERDGLAVLYRDEAEILYRRLCLSESMASQVSQDRAKLKEKMILKQQELESTRDSYQQQLSAMSDHVCELNEQISIYRELQQATKQSQTSGNNGTLFKRTDMSSSPFITPSQVQFQPASSRSPGSSLSGTSRSNNALNLSSSDLSSGANLASGSTGSGSLASIGSNTLKSAGANLRNIFR